MPPFEQSLDRIIRDVGGKQEKAGTDDSERVSLSSLTPPFVGVPAQPPERRDAAGDLDRGIEAEADQRDATGEIPRDERDEAFERIPCDGGVLQEAAVARGRCPQLYDIRSCAVCNGHVISAARPP